MSTFVHNRFSPSRENSPVNATSIQNARDTNAPSYDKDDQSTQLRSKRSKRRPLSSSRRKRQRCSSSPPLSSELISLSSSPEPFQHENFESSRAYSPSQKSTWSFQNVQVSDMQEGERQGDEKSMALNLNDGGYNTWQKSPHGSQDCEKIALEQKSDSENRAQVMQGIAQKIREVVERLRKDAGENGDEEVNTLLQTALLNGKGQVESLMEAIDKVIRGLEDCVRMACDETATLSRLLQDSETVVKLLSCSRKLTSVVKFSLEKKGLHWTNKFLSLKAMGLDKNYLAATTAMDEFSRGVESYESRYGVG